MRCEADGVVVLLGAEPKGAGAEFFQDFYEGGDARIFLFGRGTDQRVGIVAEEVGIGMRDARQFPAGHGMATEKDIRRIFGEKICSVFGDSDFCAASVCSESVRGG